MVRIAAKLHALTGQDANCKEDYMHFTKRFGIVGASQLPLHYLLAMKSTYSPLQLITRLSHEQLNVAHKVLGQIIRILLTAHACFYLNFFILNNILAKRIQSRDVILGLTCIAIIHITSMAAFARIRKWNYRLFYTVHVTCATIFLPLAFFHVSHIRPFIWESAFVYILHVALRVLATKEHSGTLSLVPSTNLVQISVPLHGPTRQYKPGQHVYFSLQAEYPGSAIPNVLLHNPFTVASLPKKDGQLLLVARALNGNTRRLAALARSADLQDPSIPRSLPLKIEGPYGISSHLPSLGRFDRILLVAGGVGATFIIPLWRDILDSKRSGERLFHTDVRLVWAVRKISETSWALPLAEGLTSDKNTGEMSSEAELYVTSDNSGSLASDSHDTIELAETNTLVDADDEKSLTKQGFSIKHHRPDLRDIVDDTFSGQAGRVAVLVCGPVGMGQQLRREARKWVWRGKDVYYHAEIFGL